MPAELASPLQTLLKEFLRTHPLWSVRNVTPGARLRVLLKGPGSQFEFWIAAASRQEPAFKKTAHFLVGHSGTLAAKDIREMDAVCASILHGERHLDATQAKQLLEPVGPPTFLGSDLELRITTRCNEACPFCSARGWAENRMTSREQIQQTIDEAKRSGATRVVFTGGEPTLVDSLPELISYAKNLGLAVVLQTNGLVPSSMDWWYRLQRQPGTSALPNSIFLSLHSQYQERMQVQTGVPMTLHKKLAAARNAHAMGVGVAINFVLTRLNLDELHDFPRFIAARLGRYPELVLSVAAPVGAMEQAQDLQLSVTQLAAPLRTALINSRRVKLRTQVAEACGVPICVLPDQADLFAAFNRTAPVKTLAADRVKAPDCRHCRYDAQCIGVWRSYADTFGMDEFRPA